MSPTSSKAAALDRRAEVDRMKKLNDLKLTGKEGRLIRKQATAAAQKALDKRIRTRKNGTTADRNKLNDTWHYNPEAGPKHLNKGYTARYPSSAEQFRMNPMMYGRM